MSWLDVSQLVSGWSGLELGSVSQKGTFSTTGSVSLLLRYGQGEWMSENLKAVQGQGDHSLAEVWPFLLLPETGRQHRAAPGEAPGLPGRPPCPRARAGPGHPLHHFSNYIAPKDTGGQK